MDIAILSGDSLRIKGKNAAIIVNPVAATGKTEANAILILNKTLPIDDSKIEGSRITIKGPGEYEVGGIKVSAILVGENLVARINVDSVNVLTGSGELIEKTAEKLEGSDIVVVNADTKFNYSGLATLEPKVLLAYGQLKDEIGKSIGKEEGEKVAKYSTTADKLPSEMQYVVLG